MMMMTVTSTESKVYEMTRVVFFFTISQSNEIKLNFFLNAFEAVLMYGFYKLGVQVPAVYVEHFT